MLVVRFHGRAASLTKQDEDDPRVVHVPGEPSVSVVILRPVPQQLTLHAGTTHNPFGIVGFTLHSAGHVCRGGVPGELVAVATCLPSVVVLHSGGADAVNVHWLAHEQIGAFGVTTGVLLQISGQLGPLNVSVRFNVPLQFCTMDSHCA